MKFGHFDDKQKEYVIDTPETPYPWINYLGNESFFSLVSNTCGGYSFYKDARFRRISRYIYNNSSVDTNGKYFYIKDGSEIWNPGWKPVKTSLDSYECRHGMGYSKFKSSKNQLSAELLTFVPLKFNGEIQHLKLKNESNEIKDIKLFSYVEFCLWDALDDMTNFQRNFSIGRAETHGNGIIHFTDYRDRRDHFAFHSVNHKVDKFDCNREDFLGIHNGLESPVAIANGELTGSRAFGWSPIGATQINIQLQPGEEIQLIYMLGYVENEEKWNSDGTINTIKMEDMQKQFATTEQVEIAFIELKNFWENLLSTYRVDSPHNDLNRVVNIWNQYQCMVTFNMSRSASFFESGIGRGMGFRDSNQDLLGFVHQIPERARERLIDLASTQMEDGGAYHQYQPLTKKGNVEMGGNFNDDPLWMIAAVVAYLKETGDFNLLNENVPFDNDESKAGSMFEHLKRAFYKVAKNTGPHGLPLIGRADWNDCLNMNILNEDPDVSFQTGPQKTDGKVAESLMIAGAFVLYGSEFAELCTEIGKNKEAELALESIDLMRKNIEEHGWDGNWFLRAYDAQGKKVGSNENEQGKIFIESQGYCSMAGIGLADGKVEKALNSVKERLDTPYGIVLVNPAFTTYHKELGEISTFLPGYKENAGIFCHNNPWIIIGETLLGRGDEAFEYWKKIAPSYTEDVSEIHKTEPYVYSQMVAGKDAYKPGEAKNSWLTGTAAWNFVAITQYILGIKPQYKGLEIDPCIPKAWKGYKVKRKYRGATYDISIKNPQGISKGVSSITVDGQKIEGNIIPVDLFNKEHTVEVILG